MQAARYLGVPFHEVEGLPWFVVRTWGLIALAAENEAHEALAKMASK